MRKNHGSTALTNHLGVFTEEEIKQILAVVSDDKYGIRDRAMVELFYSTGLRRSELASLDVADVDFRTREILIRKGKGEKERIVPVGEKALEVLREYLVIRKKFLGRNRDCGALFLTSRGRRPVPDKLSRRICLLKEKAGIISKGLAHAFRHSFATHTLANGAPLEAIRRMLGHAQLSTTQMYAHIDREKLSEVHKRTHPKAMEAE